MSTQHAITPTRAENYPEWYQAVIAAAELAEHSPVRGCMVIKPGGYALWENIQRELDQRFKATGHVNAYFPLLIPRHYFEKEAKHVEGFAKECAVVTHVSLRTDEQGNLIPDSPLEEPLIIRPTSEMVIGEVYAGWVESYRDLPILINQWANVMRWEMRTRLFLRTSEFLWQEGHTVHATADEAMQETLQMLAVYADFAKDFLAMPVIRGEKPIFERFPGAVNTYCIEAMMQDRKALQAGTSHFLGQNFSKACSIQFLNRDGVQEYAWTTSWGASTRLIGGLIMTHSDDDGFVAPPRVAQYQVVILPVIHQESDKNQIIDYCMALKQQLQQQSYHDEKLRVYVDLREMRGGEKNWQWIKRGAPIRIEIGGRELQQQRVTLARRDETPSNRHSIPLSECIDKMKNYLDQIQQNLWQRALDYRTHGLFVAHSLEEFNAYFAPTKQQEEPSGFVVAMAMDDPNMESYLKPLKITARCIPFDADLPSHLSPSSPRCIFTNQLGAKKMIFARAY